MDDSNGFHAEGGSNAHKRRPIVPGYYTDRVKAYICRANIITPGLGLLGDGYAQHTPSKICSRGRTPVGNAALVSQLATHPGGRW